MLDLPVASIVTVWWFVGIRMSAMLLGLRLLLRVCVMLCVMTVVLGGVMFVTRWGSL